MSANQVFLGVLFVMAMTSLYFHLASLRWGLQWANVARVSWLKALGLIILFGLVGGLTLVLVCIVFPPVVRVINGPTGTFVLFAYSIAVASVVVASLYRLRLGQSIKAVIPYFAMSALLTAIAVFLIRPFAYEAFLIPTNSMAPTLLGEHLTATCPQCGAPAYGSPPSPYSVSRTDETQMICSKELRSFWIANPPAQISGGDRLLVSKLIQPKRWDLIVFATPEDPSVKYVKRLVGLPGEKLAIHDGAIWINDEKMVPPDSIRGIRYVATIDAHGVTMSGAGSFPVELGADEYFVLGDFVDAAYDSRFWKKGAPNHPPYALPASHIDGVVVNVYWPPSRWKGFR
jgi:signal peptidase I